MDFTDAARALVLVGVLAGCAPAATPPPISAEPAAVPATDSMAEERRPELLFEPVRFALESGDTVPAERGEIRVLENRSDPNSRTILIRFLRFGSRAEKPAAPIVYLAGGPGGSGTGAARHERWAMFNRLRDVADIIILDQRGTGLSDSVPNCDSSTRFPADSATTRDLYVRLHRAALRECLGFWEREGVDIRGYTTWESAADIDAVREALGVERVNLLGISYGTHLALATLKRYPDHVDRLVLASAEGLGETVKRPALTDAYFERLQTAINADSAAAARYPNVRALIRRVLDQVAANPPRITVRLRNGEPFERTLGPFEMQLITGYMISDPDRVTSILGAYVKAAEGQYGFFSDVLQPTISFGGMPEAMDLASGISPERLARVQAEADTALLGDALNFPVPHLRGTIPSIDLGEEFREPVVSDRPALFLSGTLDGRTYPEAHARDRKRLLERFNRHHRKCRSQSVLQPSCGCRTDRRVLCWRVCRRSYAHSARACIRA